MGFSYNYPLTLLERGRAGTRGWNQGASVTRARSTSRDRMQGVTGQIPKEGEHLLERLTVS